MDDASILNLKRDIKRAFNWNDQEVEDWWNKQHPFLSWRTPKQMCEDEISFKRLKTLITFSVKGFLNSND